MLFWKIHWYLNFYWLQNSKNGNYTPYILLLLLASLSINHTACQSSHISINILRMSQNWYIILKFNIAYFLLKMMYIESLYMQGYTENSDALHFKYILTFIYCPKYNKINKNCIHTKTCFLQKIICIIFICLKGHSKESGYTSSHRWRCLEVHFWLYYNFSLFCSKF